MPVSKKRKKFLQGKKVKFYHNPGLMRSHPAGAKVTIMQPFANSDSGGSGLIPAIFRATWEWNIKHAAASVSFYENDILKQPEISIESMYIISHHLIMDLWLAFEHILNDIIRSNFGDTTADEFESKSLHEKLEKVESIQKYSFLTTDIRVNFLKTDLKTLRDAVMHPKRSTTIYNSDPQNYKTIPHVWLHSGAYKQCCKALFGLLDDIKTAFLNKQK